MRPEFDTFLFAPIGADRNGMQVSVLSGLARSDLDPWQEATKLAELPPTGAIERLAMIIEALPSKVWARPEATAAATRLVALLPQRRVDGAIASRMPDRLGLNARPWWVYLVLMSFVLGSQFLIASQHQPPATQQGDVSSVGDVAPIQPPVNPAL
ncbi:hypothetical protein [Bradyrhizobium sp.]|uniref:hypothetical protein n=1 Tax=Bradyrhizobium sp. TaxID=376 RepID=UPI003C6354AB